jgi:hypothetical protein
MWLVWAKVLAPKEPGAPPVAEQEPLHQAARQPRRLGGVVSVLEKRSDLEGGLSAPPPVHNLGTGGELGLLVCLLVGEPEVYVSAQPAEQLLIDRGDRHNLRQGKRVGTQDQPTVRPQS